MCQAQLPLPPSRRSRPAFSSLPVPVRSSARPERGKPLRSVGIRLSTTLTAPPMAPLPKKRLAGPFSTSMLSARNGSTVTAWSTLTVETSSVDRPFARTETRAPSRPRTIGRPTPGPKWLLCTPGKEATVSPKVPVRRSSRATPASTSAGRASSSSAVSSGLAVTFTSSSLRASSRAACVACGWVASAAKAGAESAAATDRARAERTSDRVMNGIRMEWGGEAGSNP